MKALRHCRSVANIAFGNLYELGSREFLNLVLDTNFYKNPDVPLISQSDERVEFLEERPPEKGLRLGSVSVLFYHDEVGTLCDECDEGLYVVVCEKQAKDLSYEHAGAMVFPGGLLLEHETPRRGCVRETNEEISFSSKDGSVEANWYFQIKNGLPSMHVNVSNIDVYPFIGVVTKTSSRTTGEEIDFDTTCMEREILEVNVLDKKELRKAFLINVKDLIDAYEPTGLTVIHNRSEVGPTFEIDGLPQIWGISARLFAYMLFCMEERFVGQQNLT